MKGRKQIYYFWFVLSVLLTAFSIYHFDFFHIRFEAFGNMGDAPFMFPIFGLLSSIYCFKRIRNHNNNTHS